MADVTGPISTLPGAVYGLPAGTMCDDHPNVPAYRRIQGETDSMGSEMHDMCKECYDAHVEARKTADTSGRCDYCKTHAPALSPRRDPDEGMAGPVYYVCRPCIVRANERARQEAEEDDSYYGRDDDWGD